MEPKYYSIMIFTAGIFLGLFILYFYVKNQIDRILKEEKASDHYKKGLFGFIRLVNVLKKSKGGYNKDQRTNISIQTPANTSQEIDLKKKSDEYDKLKKKYDKLKEKHDELVANHDSLIENNDSISSLMEEKNTPTELKSVDLPPTTSKNKNLDEQKDLAKLTTYYSIPQSDGSFDFDNGKKLKDEDSFYKIEYLENEERGLLFYIPGELDIRAIDAIDSYLLAVCEIENIEKREEATRIELVSPGKVIKNNTSWKIDPNYKVKIKFV